MHCNLFTKKTLIVQKLTKIRIYINVTHKYALDSQHTKKYSTCTPAEYINNGFIKKRTLIVKSLSL